MLNVSALKRKSSIALIIGIILVLVLIPLWYTMLVPLFITSEIEKIDTTTSFEGTITGMACESYYGVWELPIRIEAHAYVEAVKGDNIVLRTDVTMLNITNPDEPNKLEDFSYNSTYVINKFTLENVPNAPEADKNRTGYDPLYPMHLKAGENISNVWLDTINKTSTLEFKESVKEEGLTLYRYSVEENFTRIMSISPFLTANYTIIYEKTILVEPVSGLPVYTENETLTIFMTPEPGEPYPPTFKVMLIIYPLTYKSTAEAKADGLATAKSSYEGLQLLEYYIPTILGLVATILTIGLALNLRRLRRKMAPEAKT